MLYAEQRISYFILNSQTKLNNYIQNGFIETLTLIRPTEFYHDIAFIIYIATVYTEVLTSNSFD